MWKSPDHCIVCCILVIKSELNNGFYFLSLYVIFFVLETLKYYGSRLTDYEKTEIKKYPEVWYFGLKACKILGEDGASQNGGYDDDNGSYNKVLPHLKWVNLLRIRSSTDYYFNLFIILLSYYLKLCTHKIY